MNRKYRVRVPSPVRSVRGRARPSSPPRERLARTRVHVCSVGERLHAIARVRGPSGPCTSTPSRRRLRGKGLKRGKNHDERKKERATYGEKARQHEAWLVAGVHIHDRPGASDGRDGRACERGAFAQEVRRGRAGTTKFPALSALQTFTRRRPDINKKGGGIYVTLDLYGYLP